MSARAKLADAQRRAFGALASEGEYSAEFHHPARAQAFFLRCLRRVLPADMPSHGYRVLECGCGTGAWLSLVQRELAGRRTSARADIFGFDLTPEMVDLARANLGASVAADALRVGDVLDDAAFAFRGGVDRFALVYAYDLVQQVPRSLQRAALDNMFRHVAPGGALIVFDHEAWSAYGMRMAAAKAVTRLTGIELVPRYYCNARYPWLGALGAALVRQIPVASEILVGRSASQVRAHPPSLRRAGRAFGTSGGFAVSVSLSDAARAIALSPTARWAAARDLRRAPEPPPEASTLIEACLRWLAQTQDRSRSSDGGAARDFSLVGGWASSYPETTGYIIPTLIACRSRLPDLDLAGRARRMLDWLVRIQLSSGGFQGGRIDAPIVVPVTFNTGQILLGLAEGIREFGAPYRESLRRAADWLVETQDADGAWRRHPTPFAEPGEKTYETHVAWGLIEAERVMPGRGYGEAALRNVAWAVSHQRPNGWMARCCLSDPQKPLTHTLGYALRGIIEAYRFSDEPALLTAAGRLADGLLAQLRPDGFLAGRYDGDWRPRVRWSCLTGSAQIAACWSLLARATSDRRYGEAASRVNRFLARRVSLDGPLPLRGAVAGAFPLWGDYCRFEYPNWAAKFLVDSLILADEEAGASAGAFRGEQGRPGT